MLSKLVTSHAFSFNAYKKEPLFAIASLCAVLFPVLLIFGSSVADIGMSLITILFIIHSYKEKNWTWCHEGWVRILFVLWCYMIMRGFLTDNPAESLRRALPFGRYFIFSAALAYWILQEKMIQDVFIKVLTLAILFMAIDGIIQWYLGKDIFQHTLYLLSDDSLRLTGPFHSPILGIMLAWLSFPVFLPWIMDNNGKIKKPPQLFKYLLAIILLIAVITLSNERMALLLVLLGWVITMFMLPVKKIYLMALFAIGLCLIDGIFIISPSIFDHQIFATLKTIDNWQDSSYGRLLESDMKVAAINPIFGVGANYFRIMCPKIYPGQPLEVIQAFCNIHPHNIYMEWLIEEGVIGFTLFLAFIATIFIACFKHWKTYVKSPYFIGFFIAFTIRIWPLASSTGFYSRWGAPPFWFIVGALIFYSATSVRQDIYRP